MRKFSIYSVQYVIINSFKITISVEKSDIILDLLKSLASGLIEEGSFSGLFLGQSVVIGHVLYQHCVPMRGPGNERTDDIFISLTET